MTENSDTQPSPAAARAARAETIRIIGAYVRARVVAETEERGAAATLAKRTGFTRSAIVQMRQGKNAPSEEFCRVMADVWGLTYQQLEEVARASHAMGETRSVDAAANH